MEEQDKLYTSMKARWVEVDKSCKEWSVKLDELAGMWTKQTGTFTFAPISIMIK